MKRCGDQRLRPWLGGSIGALGMGLALWSGVVSPPILWAQKGQLPARAADTLQLAPLTLVESTSTPRAVPPPLPATLPPILPRTAPPPLTAQTKTELPPPTPLPTPKSLPPVPQTKNGKALPISLDTVLRLAQDQNGKLALAREKLNEAFAEAELAARKWLPELTIGPSFNRHEGGIQDFQGNLVRSSYGGLFAGVEMNGRFDLRDAAYQKILAERGIWQKKGELSKLSTDTLLDAVTTYVDLLTAHCGEAISLDVERRFQDLLKRAQTLAGVDPGARVEVVRIEAELVAQQQYTRKLREGARAAQAKLIYLLGLDPAMELMVLERQMAVFHLVDASRPVDQLVDLALFNGPGVRELEGLLALIDNQRCKNQGLQRFLPVFEANVAEGAFGAGSGANLAWDNRFDLCLHARWNLSNLFTMKQQQCLQRAKIQQAHLSYQDLRAKLTLGVYEAREATLSNLEQIHLSKKQIYHAQEAYNLSDSRLRNHIRGSSASEVLMAIGSVAKAQFRYLEALRDHDKAQMRLFVLLGVPDESVLAHPASN